MLRSWSQYVAAFVPFLFTRAHSSAITYWPRPSPPTNTPSSSNSDGEFISTDTTHSQTFTAGSIMNISWATSFTQTNIWVVPDGDGSKRCSLVANTVDSYFAWTVACGDSCVQDCGATLVVKATDAQATAEDQRNGGFFSNEFWIGNAGSSSKSLSSASSVFKQNDIGTASSISTSEVPSPTSFIAIPTGTPSSTLLKESSSASLSSTASSSASSSSEANSSSALVSVFSSEARSSAKATSTQTLSLSSTNSSRITSSMSFPSSTTTRLPPVINPTQANPTPSISEQSNQSRSIAIGFGVGAGLALIAMAGGLFFLWRRWRQKEVKMLAYNAEQQQRLTQFGQAMAQSPYRQSFTGVALRELSTQRMSDLYHEAPGRNQDPQELLNKTPRASKCHV